MCLEETWYNKAAQLAGTDKQLDPQENMPCVRYLCSCSRGSPQLSFLPRGNCLMPKWYKSLWKKRKGEGHWWQWFSAAGTEKHAAWAKSAWICLCKCLIVMRTILLQILSCRIYLVWKSGRCSHLLLALIAQEGNAKWPLIVFSSFCVMFYSLIRCLLLENDLVAQNSTWRK